LQDCAQVITANKFRFIDWNYVRDEPSAAIPILLS
jgi:hypothetical protein